VGKLRERLVARKQRKAHERYLRERARQQALQGQDVQEAIRAVSRGSAGAQQGMFGQM
jgi:hypothetical protein